MVALLALQSKPTHEVGREVNPSSVRSTVKEAAIASLARRDLLEAVSFVAEEDNKNGSDGAPQFQHFDAQIQINERRHLVLVTDAELWVLR